MWEERVVRQVATRQHGLVHRAQLLARGVTDAEVEWRTANGRLEAMHPGVYYLDCTPATWKTEVLAAVMAAGPDALASHRCAAVLWSLDAVHGRMLEITVPYLESPEPRGAIVHRTRRPNPHATHEAIPVSPPEKALLDMAALLPDRTLWKAARSAVSRGLTTPERMDLAVAVYGGRGVAGTRRMRRVIGLVADDESASVAEIDLKALVDEAPIPPPVQQLRIGLPDGSNAYPDFAWPDRKRVVEVDGFGAHGTPEQLETDLRRQNQLMEMGWEIRRFTATEVRDHPQRVQDELVNFVNKPFL
jgi:hypothetical protein